MKCDTFLELKARREESSPAPARHGLPVLTAAPVFLGQQSRMCPHHPDSGEAAQVSGGSGSCGCENLANPH